MKQLVKRARALKGTCQGCGKACRIPIALLAARKVAICRTCSRIAYPALVGGLKVTKEHTERTVYV